MLWARSPWQFGCARNPAKAGWGIGQPARFSVVSMGCHGDLTCGGALMNTAADETERPSRIERPRLEGALWFVVALTAAAGLGLALLPAGARAARIVAAIFGAQI